MNEAKLNFNKAQDLDSNCLHTLERIAHCELELRNIEKAKELFTKAIYLIKELYDEDHPILEKI